MPSRRQPPSLDDHILALNRYDDADQDLKDKIHSLLQGRCEVDPETGCVIFVGAWEENGQGKVRVGSRVYGVNRVAAWLYLPGYELWDEQVVQRTCQNPACFNEEHLLLLDDQAEALRRQTARGRIGANHRKLDRAKARQMRALAALGVTVPELVERFGVQATAVRAVLAYRTWPEPEEGAHE